MSRSRRLAKKNKIQSGVGSASLYSGSDNFGGTDSAKKQLIRAKQAKLKRAQDGDNSEQNNSGGAVDIDALLGSGSQYFGSDSVPEQPGPTELAPDPTIDSATPPAPVAPVSTQAAVTVNVPQDQAGDLVFKRSEFNTVVQRAATDLLEPTIAQYKQQIDAMTANGDRQRAEMDQVVTHMREQLHVLESENKRLTDVFQATGSSVPGLTQRGANGAIGGSYKVNFLSYGLSKEPQGSARDFVDFIGNPQYVKSFPVMDEGKRMYMAQDHRVIDSFVRQHREALRKDMELYAQGNGLLRGMGADAFTAGQTIGGTGGGVSEAFLSYLSSEMRMAKHALYIWWQFANAGIGLGTPVGSTILIPMFANLNEAQSENDFVLEDLTLATAADRINAGTANRQALSMNTVPIVVKGYGLGKAGGPQGTEPVSIPEFIQVTSLVQLLGVLNTKLTLLYNSFVDVTIRHNYRKARYNADNVYYNNSGSAVNAVPAAAAGSDGTCTEAFLAEMSMVCTAKQIPTLTDGRRIAILSSKATSQLKTDLGSKWQAATPEQLSALTNILKESFPDGEAANVQGYMGDYEGFHCFYNYSSSNGAPGSEGVYLGNAVETGAATVDLGTDYAAVTYRDSFFFGRDAVGRGVSLPMQIRMNPTTNFDRMYDFIWREIGANGSIGVSSVASDGTTATNEQDCVVIGRTSDTVL